MKFTRRRFVEIMKNSAIFLLVFLGFSKFGRIKADELELRPPGAVDEEAFIAGCIRCGVCVDTCLNRYTGVLKPMTLADGYYNAGLPTFNTPKTYCLRCMECTTACPTGVLKEVPSDKLGIGTAFINIEECLAYNGEDCLECVKHCEIGAAVEINDLPTVKEDICDGCGTCVYFCPAKTRYLKPDASKRQPRR